PDAERQAKCDLLRWRTHGLLGELTGDLAHHYEAVLLRPDLTVARTGLGATLLRTGRPREAVTHLRRALHHDPFDSDAARGLPGACLCMIVRNEEKNLPDCLESVQGLFAQTVVADTGSADGTREVARRFGAEVVEFPWCDDFAAARNASLRHARRQWVMWLDA